MLDVGFVNLVSVIVQNPKVTAINSCIEVDLTGQVVSDSIGTRMYSGNVHKTFGEWVQDPVSRAYLVLRTFLPLENYSKHEDNGYENSMKQNAKILDASVLVLRKLYVGLTIVLWCEFCLVTF